MTALPADTRLADAVKQIENSSVSFWEQYLPLMQATKQAKRKNCNIDPPGAEELKAALEAYVASPASRHVTCSTVALSEWADFLGNNFYCSMVCGNRKSEFGDRVFARLLQDAIGKKDKEAVQAIVAAEQYGYYTKDGKFRDIAPRLQEYQGLMSASGNEALSSAFSAGIWQMQKDMHWRMELDAPRGEERYIKQLAANFSFLPHVQMGIVPQNILTKAPQPWGGSLAAGATASVMAGVVALVPVAMKYEKMENKTQASFLGGMFIAAVMVIAFVGTYGLWRKENRDRAMEQARITAFKSNQRGSK